MPITGTDGLCSVEVNNYFYRDPYVVIYVNLNTCLIHAIRFLRMQKKISHNRYLPTFLTYEKQDATTWARHSWWPITQDISFRGSFAIFRHNTFSLTHDISARPTIFAHEAFSEIQRCNGYTIVCHNFGLFRKISVFGGRLTIFYYNKCTTLPAFSAMIIRTRNSFWIRQNRAKSRTSTLNFIVASPLFYNWSYWS